MHETMENLVFYPRQQNAVGKAYADLTMDPGFLRYTNARELLAQFFLRSHFNVTRVNNWREMCIGLSSMYMPARDPLGKFGSLTVMPMYDYDGRYARSTLKKDVALLQGKYGFGPAWVYKTKRGYHVYFFCDIITQKEALIILEEVHCCEGFKRITKRRGYSVLRLSAKYTEFDIVFDSIIPSPEGKLKRKTAKAHIVEYLLGLGTECGTHFAKLFPQWANFQEDKKPWRPPRKRDPHEKGKLIRKAAEAPGIKPAPKAQLPKDAMGNPNEMKYPSEADRLKWFQKLNVLTGEEEFKLYHYFHTKTSTFEEENEVASTKTL